MSNNDHDANAFDPVAGPTPPRTATPRCKHDAKMVDEINARLLKIKAVADLMMCTRGGDLPDDTLGNIGWLMIDLVEEAKDILSETREVMS